MSTPFDGRFGGAPLIRKYPKWPGQQRVTTDVLPNTVIARNEFTATFSR